jgi:hypothetical protein
VTAQRDDDKADCNAALGDRNTLVMPDWRTERLGTPDTAEGLIMTSHRKSFAGSAQGVFRKLDTGPLGWEITRRL